SNFNLAIFDNKGKIKFDSNALNTDWDLLQEELGFFYLNEELNKLYEEKQNLLDSIKARADTIVKPIIYSEGNNYKYLEKAKSIFANDLDIDIKDCGGKNELQKLFKLFVKTDFDRFKIFFVFDCDAKASFIDCNSLKTSSLIPYIFKENQKNTIEEVQSGIENLFPDELFELKDEFYFFDVNEHKRNGEIKSRSRSLRKINFENFILNERNENSDFDKFQDLFEFINSKINNPV
ncbi:hypothetical protein HGB13_04870, partial [bacterium]|nr:hypothetical protein [bacterium]